MARALRLVVCLMLLLALPTFGLLYRKQEPCTKEPGKSNSCAVGCVCEAVSYGPSDKETHMSCEDDPKQSPGKWKSHFKRQYDFPYYSREALKYSCPEGAFIDGKTPKITLEEIKGIKPAEYPLTSNNKKIHDMMEKLHGDFPPKDVDDITDIILGASKFNTKTHLTQIKPGKHLYNQVQKQNPKMTRKYSETDVNGMAIDVQRLLLEEVRNNWLEAMVAQGKTPKIGNRGFGQRGVRKIEMDAFNKDMERVMKPFEEAIKRGGTPAELHARMEEIIHGKEPKWDSKSKTKPHHKSISLSSIPYWEKIADEMFKKGSIAFNKAPYSLSISIPKSNSVSGATGSIPLPARDATFGDDLEAVAENNYGDSDYLFDNENRNDVMYDYNEYEQYSNLWMSWYQYVYRQGFMDALKSKRKNAKNHHRNRLIYY